jgi:uncharacterized protein
MDIAYRKLLEQAKKQYKENKKYFQKLKKKNPGEIDPLMARLHDQVFMNIDCLACANCCKGTGPLLRERDISRLSKALRMKPGDFTKNYLRIDEEEDYVFKTLPCPFLGADNYCSVYESRPGACRDYPHTNHMSFRKYTPQMLENTLICPAVFLIFEKMKELIF